MESATLWIAFVSAVATCGAAVFAGFAMVRSSKAETDAAKSADRAEKAQTQALNAWRATADALQQSNEHAKRASRAPLAHLVNEVGQNMLLARYSGVSEIGEYPEMAAHMGPLGKLQFTAAHDSARKLTRWVSEFAREVPLSNPGSLLEAMKTIGDRVRNWVDDPDSAMAVIRADPRVPERRADPGDTADWRLQ